MKYLKHLSASFLIVSLLLGCGEGSSSSGSSSIPSSSKSASWTLDPYLGLSCTAPDVLSEESFVGVTGEVHKKSCTWHCATYAGKPRQLVQVDARKTIGQNADLWEYASAPFVGEATENGCQIYG